MRPARTALAAVGALLAVAPAATAAPRAGDWEATGAHEARASFEITKHALTDLVVQAPISCSNSFGTPLSYDTEVLSSTVKLASNGSFSSGKIGRRGSGTAFSGRLHDGAIDLRYRHVSRAANPYEGGEEVCDTGTARLTARPGHRRTVRDGIWEGETNESEPVQLNVVAGGRALTSPDALGPGGTEFYAFEVAGSSDTDLCSYTLSSSLLLSPDGSFSNSLVTLGDDADVAGAFSKHSVSGQFSNQGEGCAADGWNAKWAFSRP
jgi:hypothetical protein